MGGLLHFWKDLVEAYHVMHLSAALGILVLGLAIIKFFTEIIPSDDSKKTVAKSLLLLAAGVMLLWGGICLLNYFKEEPEEELKDFIVKPKATAPY